MSRDIAQNYGVQLAVGECSLTSRRMLRHETGPIPGVNMA